MKIANGLKLRGVLLSAFLCFTAYLLLAVGLFDLHLYRSLAG